MVTRPTGTRIAGTVLGVAVTGLWTGRGILVEHVDHHDTVLMPVTIDMTGRWGMREALFLPGIYIQAGGEYLLDSDHYLMQD